MIMLFPKPGETFADVFRRNVLTNRLPTYKRNVFIVAAEAIPALTRIDPKYRWLIQRQTWQVFQNGNWEDITTPFVIHAVADRLQERLDRACIRDRWGIEDVRSQHSILVAAGKYSVVRAAVRLLQTSFETEISVYR